MLLYATLISALVLAHSKYTHNKPPQLRGLIVGGEDAKITEFPHQISLRLYGGHRCGGSIYKSNIVITAGHCVIGLGTKKLTVVAGTTFLNEDYLESEVKKIIIHEGFDKRTLDYDVAILVLDKPLSFDSNVQPIRLASKDAAVGSKVIVTGWGSTYEGGSVVNQLQKVDVDIISQQECQELYNDYLISERMLCAAVDAGGKDSCQGDSGGPLISADSNELLGIVSWGRGCARPRKPGVYASVPNLYDWIVKTAEDNGGL